MPTENEIAVKIRYPIGTVVKTVSLNNGGLQDDRIVSSIIVAITRNSQSVTYGISRLNFKGYEEYARSYLETPSDTIQSAKETGVSPGTLGIYLPDEEAEVMEKISDESEIYKNKMLEQRGRDLMSYINGQKAAIRNAEEMILKHERELAKIAQK